MTPRSQRAASLLQTPVSVSFIRPERFGAIVRRIAKESSGHVLVDWRGAAQMGWNPEAQLPFATGGQPLGETLRALLEPMELAYRIVDRDTLQITSRQAIDAHVELEFYPVSDLLGTERTAEQLLDAVKLQLGEGVLSEQGGSGVLRFESSSKCLLAALSQPLQQSLAKILAGLRWRKEALAANECPFKPRNWGWWNPVVHEELRPSRRCRMYKKYVVRLSKQERD